MKKEAIKKLNSTRGSGIAEALVGFLISVLSVITLLSVATTTLELIKQSDESIVVLYEEEGAMDQFINGNEENLDENGELYTGYSDGGVSVDYVIYAQGVVPQGNDPQVPTFRAAVKYYVTNRHHLFGFVPK